jgi:hypothetical protein
MKQKVALLFMFGTLLLSGCTTTPSPSGLLPKYDFSGNWSSDGSVECAEVHRDGLDVVFTYNNAAYTHTFEGNYIDEQTIAGIQKRTKVADGTTTRMLLAITLQSPNNGKTFWIALDSNSDLYEGQAGVAIIRRVANPLQ